VVAFAKKKLELRADTNNNDISVFVNLKAFYENDLHAVTTKTHEAKDETDDVKRLQSDIHFIKHVMHNISKYKESASALLQQLQCGNEFLKRIFKARSALSELISKEGEICYDCQHLDTERLKKLIAVRLENNTVHSSFRDFKNGVGWFSRQLNFPGVNRALEALYSRCEQLTFDPLAAVDVLLKIKNPLELTVGEARINADNILAIIPFLSSRMLNPRFDINLQYYCMTAFDYPDIYPLIAPEHEILNTPKALEEKRFLDATCKVFYGVARHITIYSSLMKEIHKHVMDILSQQESKQQLEKLTRRIIRKAAEANARQKAAGWAKKYLTTAKMIADVEYKTVPGYLTFRGKTFIDQIGMCLMMHEKLRAFAEATNHPMFDLQHIYKQAFQLAVGKHRQWQSNLMTKYALATHEDCCAELEIEAKANNNRQSSQPTTAAAAAAATVAPRPF